MSEANVDGLLPLIDSAGQHHIDHARFADQIDNPDRRAATGKEATLAFGQSEIGAAVGDPNMGRAGEFETSANDGPFECRNDRDAAVLHLVERFVPAQADMHELLGAAVLIVVFNQIKPSTEVISFGGQNNGTHAFAGRFGKQVDQLFDRCLIQRVAFGRAVQGHDQDALLIF